MSRHICPRCNRVYIKSFDTKDFIHDCNSGNPALDNEDIVVYGNWEDTRGVAQSQSTREQMLKSIVNRNFGTKAEIEGEDVENRTRRGKRKSTHGTRKHFEYIEGC